MSEQPLEIQCKGDIDRLDPIGNLGRFALSTQGSYKAAIAWLERDIANTENAKGPKKQKDQAISDKKQAIYWLASEMKRTGAA